MGYNSVSLLQGMIRLDFVIDAACVGLEDPIKGHVPVGFIVIDKSKQKLKNDRSVLIFTSQCCELKPLDTEVFILA